MHIQEEKETMPVLLVKRNTELQCLDFCCFDGTCFTKENYKTIPDLLVFFKQEKWGKPIEFEVMGVNTEWNK